MMRKLKGSTIKKAASESRRNLELWKQSEIQGIVNRSIFIMEEVMKYQRIYILRRKTVASRSIKQRTE